MRIKRFIASKLHGYLDFDVAFDPDLTFLTGSNGDGKTSIVYSAISLISPSPIVLANLEFRTMQVQIEHEGEEIDITAEREGSDVFIYVSGIDDRLQISKFVDVDDSYRQADKESEFYRDFMSSQNSNLVLKKIESLPTPLFLDLDRRSRYASEMPGARYLMSRTIRRARNIFSASLTNSLAESAILVGEQYARVLGEIGQIEDKLRRTMIVNLLDFDKAGYFPAIRVPRPSDIRMLTQTRQTLTHLPNILGVSAEDVEKKIGLFIDGLLETAAKIPKVKSAPELLRDRQGNDPAIRAAFERSASLPQLQRLQKMVKEIDAHNNRRRSVTEQIDRYLDIVNAFFADNGKQIRFDIRGQLSVYINKLNSERPISALSSGEAQLVVIISNLLFNPLAQQANVFIIDEPELSLHLEWQELFVDALRRANPKIQFIMSTHSPAIILDKLDHCRDIRVRTQ